MQWKTLRILGLTSVAITIAAGCTSKPTLPDDHSTKRWVVTVGGDPVARGGDDQENAGNNLQGTSGKKLKTAPFWDVGSRDVAGDRGVAPHGISKKSITSTFTKSQKGRDTLSEMYADSPQEKLGGQFSKEFSTSVSPEKLKRSVFETHIGKARVIEGDIIELSGERIRLKGIDAPEREQECFTKNDEPYKCGLVAAKALSKLIVGQKLTCKGNDRDRYGRLIAKCTLGNVDINEQMVLGGQALAYRKFGADYVRAEKAARALNEGLWQGKFVPPWDWREGKR